MPNSYIGNIAVLKDLDEHKRQIYTYDQATETVGDPLFSITAVDIKKWQSDDYDTSGMTEITRTDSTVFAAAVSGTESFKISIDEIKNMFKIIE